MLVDAALTTTDLHAVPAAARDIEAAGYDGIFSFEGGHDGFFPLLLAAEHTERVQLTTAVVIAFARNPMTLAQSAYDLQLASRGRFNLGLGTQIKPHIEKRFSMPWSHPAPRLRELVLAIRAIWATWNERVPLDFRGEFYRHTLMTPFFAPTPNPFGPPKVFLAAVGEKMTQVAGEVADGILLHGFTTERYVREVSMPALERGWAAAGKARDQFEVTGPMFVVTGATEAEMDAARVGTRRQIAFYGSTPAYRGVLELHGWGDLQTELNRLSKQGVWEAMGDLITDDVLDAFAVVGEPEDIPKLMLARYGDVLDRISFYAPYQSDPERWSRILAGFHAEH
jgi:probable F420-dependent oxidoreductase